MTVVGTLFSIAVSVKTLFFSSKKDSINIEGDNNTASIKNITQKSYVNKNTNISKEVSNSSASSEDNTILIFIQGLIVILALVVMLSFNTYIVSLLSILTLLSLVVSINRARKAEISKQGVAYIVVKHVITSVLLLSAMRVPDEIQSVTKQLKPFTFEGFSMFSDWIINSIRIVWSSLTGDAFFEKGILLLTRFIALVTIGIGILFNFPKKYFFNKMINTINDLKKAYVNLLFFYLFLTIFLHFQYIYYPFLVPFFTYIANGIKNWSNK